MDHLPTMASKKSSLSIDEKGGGVGSILTPADIVRVGGYYFGHNSMSSATREMILRAKCRACGEAANAR